MRIVRNTYLSLGSNLGDRLQNLQDAVNMLAEKCGHISIISSVYESRSWGFESDNFYNICLKLSTYLNPEILLEKILSIENHFGRQRTKDKTYRARTIDIDIIFFDDEIIFSETLLVPHPHLAERKFVLVPLAEIAPNFIHPITKISISQALRNCIDTSEVLRIDIKLTRPISLFEKYNYIAIEGNIGSGKTSLAKKLGDDFNAKLVLERFADNPFLPKFYEDGDRYAFPLEMSFLADRYHQLTEDLSQFDLFKNFIVSDYYIFKSLIFAQVTLPKEEYNLYRKMFDIMYREITKPDIYIFLYQDTHQLLENIKKRGRPYEQNIQSEYLNKIQTAYSNFIKTEGNLNTLVIDVSNLDFVNKTEDYQQVLTLINT
ncbi:MAG: 2-amino-4-hydroxy-6-hydroxymethyldihydropteridine diphosphokinase [Lutimonas sp.]